MNYRNKHWLNVIGLSWVLTACIATPTATGTRVPTVTVAQSTATSAAPSGSNPTFSSDGQSAAPFTSFPPIITKPLPVISPENVDRLGLVAKLGKGALTDLAWSPDGQWLAAFTARGVYLYDRSQRETLLIEQPRARFAFSPDGKTLATHSELSSTIQLWDVALGRVTRTFTDIDGIARFAWDMNRQLVSVSNKAIIRVWSVDSGQEIRSLDVLSPTLQNRRNAYLEDFAVSPDGKLAVWGVSWYTIRIFAAMYLLNMETGQIADSVSDLYPYQNLIFSPDSTMLADIGGGVAQTVSVYDVTDKTLRPVDTSGAGSGIADVAFTPDSANLVLAADDGEVYQWDNGGVYVWNKATGVRTRLYDSDDRLAFAALSPDGLTVAAGVGDGIRLIDVASGRELAALDGYSGSAESIAFSPSGTLLAVPAGREVTLWDLASGLMSRPFKGHTAQGILRLGFSPNGDLLAAKVVIGPLYVWETTTGNQLITIDDVISFAFSPDSRLLALGLTEGRVQLWDLASRQILYTVTQRPNVADLAFSPGGKTLALAGGWDHHDNVVLLDVATGRELRAYGKHEFGACCIAFTSDGNTLASAGIDGVRVWDVVNGQQLRFFDGIVSTRIAFSPNGKLLASTTESEGVHVWDMASLTERREIADGALGVSVAFSPDGTLLAVGSKTGVVQIWGIR